MKAMRAGGLIAVAASMLLVLSGCSAEFQVLARVVDGQLTFLACHDFDVQSITVQSSPGDFEYTDTWSLTGAAQLSEGSELVYGQAPDGLSGSDAAPVDLEAQDLQIVIHGDPDSVRTFEAGTINADHWRDQTRYVADDSDPCAEFK